MNKWGLESAVFLPSATLRHAAIFTLATSVFAVQTAAGASTGNGLGDGDALQEIVVTANKREENLLNIGGATSVVTGQFLRDTHADSLSDYVETLPNVNLAPTATAGETSIVVRGLGGNTRNTGSVVGTYIDDVPFGSSTGFSLGALLTPDLDPADLQQVEVLKGPQGTLYGAGAIAGILKYVTTKPSTDELKFGFSEEGSTVDNGGNGYALRAYANLPLVQDAAALRVSGYYRKDPGFIDDVLPGVVKPNENSALAKGFNMSLLLTPTGPLSIRIGALVQSLDSQGFNSVAVDPLTLQPVYGKYTEYKVQTETSRVTDQLYSAVVNYDFSQVSLTSASSYSRVNEATKFDDTPDAPAFGLAGDFIDLLGAASTDKATQEFRLASQQNGHFEWLAGTFYTHESSDTHPTFLAVLPGGTPDPDAPLLYSQALPTKYEEFAGFGNATYYFRPDLDFTVGYRYAYNDQHWSQTRDGLLGGGLTVYPSQTSHDDSSTYLATLRWHFDQHSMLYARAASGYRVGGPRAIPPGGVAPAGWGDTFRPETLWNYEVGIRTELFERRLMLDADVYHIVWSRIQGQVMFGPFSATSNAGNATSNGMELEAHWIPVQQLNVDATVGYANAYLAEADPTFGAERGDKLPYSPHVTASLDGRYTLPITDQWKGFAGGGVRYTAKRETDFSSVATAVSLGSFTVVDARIGARSGHYEISMFAKNIANKYAFTSQNNQSTSGPIELSALQPRTIGIGFREDF